MYAFGKVRTGRSML